MLSTLQETKMLTMRSDRLSALPEDIVSCILSLMPTKYAVTTSALSKRWRYRWMFITNLDFDYHNHPNSDKISFLKFVDRVLESYKLPQVKSFRLNISPNTVSQSTFSRWIDEAVRLNVCELNIQFFFRRLPVNILTCKTLTKLRISNASPDFSVWEDPCSVNLPCLKTLDFFFSKVPFIYVLKLIRGSPVLEVLSLELVGWSKGEEDFIFNIPTLKQLKLTLTYKPESISKKVVLNVPNVEYLFLGGYQCSSFVTENVSSLVEAYVSFGDLKSSDRLFEILKGLTGVKSLQVESFFTLKFPIGSRSSWPIFPNLKCLELKGFHDFEIVTIFLESSPQLEHLCFENQYPSHKFFKKLKPEESSWIYPKSVPACMLTNLTTVKFLNFLGKMCDTQFLEYLLENARVLKTLRIRFEDFPVIERVRLSAQALLEIPRASRYCEIHLPSTRSRLGEMLHI